MRCEQWQERIALAAGGDLREAERAGLEAHVAECAPCADELAALQRSLALLREAHEEPMAEAHFAAVRGRVLAEIDARPRRRWEWAAALAAAALLLAGVFVFLRTPHQKSSPRRPVAAVTAPPAPSIAAPARPPTRRRRLGAPIRRVRGTVNPAEVSSEPVVVKLLTDDPNVVIYWIGDSQ
ncbi:MAG TPA: zf-HC2 domain-containing protein [Bryobacteraceae bacterium]|nr:zf-HC2 domain-containing protein [Bryobacteraceae bacterium]